MTRCALALIAVLVCSASGPAAGSMLLRDGDVIFQTSRSEQSHAIQLATRSRYSHMGMIITRNGRPFVLEAIATVRLTPLREWTARGEKGHFVVKRLRDESVLRDSKRMSALRRAGLRFLGRRYDPYFEWSDARIYCSELVWKAYDRGLETQLGALAPLRSFDLSNRAVKAKLRQRYGTRVPLDERVISPDAIYRSPLLTEVR